MTHVLYARMDSEGDVLLQGPAVRAVAAGADRVTLLCGPRGAAAAGLLPGVDEVLCHHCPWIDAHPQPVTRAAMDAIVADVAARRIDQAIISTSFHQSPLPLALLLRLAGIASIVAISVDFPGALLDVRHRVDEDIHEVERALSLAAAAGYGLPPGDAGRLAAHGCVARQAPDRPYVVVHPGTSVPARAWPAGRHAELVQTLVHGGRRVVITGAASEAILTARVAGAPRPEVVDLGGRTSLAELGGVIAGADALIAGNTGPAHLAAAVGTPVVSLYAPTLPAVRWRPWAVAHELLHRDVPCADCRARDCPVAGHPCLDDVTVDEVLAALERLAPARPQRAAA